MAGPSESKAGGSLNSGYLFWGVPIIRVVVYWDLYWGPLISGAKGSISLGWKVGKGSAPTNPDFHPVLSFFASASAV